MGAARIEKLLTSIARPGLDSVILKSLRLRIEEAIDEARKQQSGEVPRAREWSELESQVSLVARALANHHANHYANSPEAMFPSGARARKLIGCIRGGHLSAKRGQTQAQPDGHSLDALRLRGGGRRPANDRLAYEGDYSV